MPPTLESFCGQAQPALNEVEMKRTRYSVAMSLYGYIAGPQGEIEQKHGSIDLAERVDMVDL